VKYPRSLRPIAPFSPMPGHARVSFFVNCATCRVKWLIMKDLNDQGPPVRPLPGGNVGGTASGLSQVGECGRDSTERAVCRHISVVESCPLLGTVAQKTYLPGTASNRSVKRGSDRRSA
jgi:hypothetical protein